MSYDDRVMPDFLPPKDRVKEAKARLEKAGVRYILSCWIDMLGIPKTKPVPISDFELLCAGKGPSSPCIRFPLSPNSDRPMPIRYRFPIWTR